MFYLILGPFFFISVSRWTHNVFLFLVFVFQTLFTIIFTIFYSLYTSVWKYVWCFPSLFIFCFTHSGHLRICMYVCMFKNKYIIFVHYIYLVYIYMRMQYVSLYCELLFMLHKVTERKEKNIQAPNFTINSQNFTVCFKVWRFVSDIMYTLQYAEVL